MPAKAKISKKKVVVDKYENHPFFVKKAEEAKAFLKKVGYPKQFAKKARSIK